MPFTDPAPALELIATYLPLLPHWPQLPKRGRMEYFTHQYLTPLVQDGILREAQGKWFFAQEAASWVEDLTAFFSLYLAAAEGEEEARRRFAPIPEAASGLYAFLDALRLGRFPRARWVKGQIAGPLSVGLNLFDPEGRPAYYEPQLRELLVKCLVQAAVWQVEALSEAGLPVVVFVDDPVVGAWGTSTYIGLEREAIIADLKEMAQAIKQAGGVAGAHACAAVDWSLLLAAGFEILSFDAYAYFPSLLPYARELKEFLDRGGLLAWGLVPTSPAAWEETPVMLAHRWQAALEELAGRGLPPGLVRARSFLTPSCGTGVLEPDLARHIYALTAATAAELLADPDG
ncbi:MAG: hypothetical protein H5U00_03620 [Clostridia bacterium]|nr:hypothetical protein [Clostridia bacterium]